MRITNDKIELEPGDHIRYKDGGRITFKTVKRDNPCAERHELDPDQLVCIHCGLTAEQIHAQQQKQKEK